MFLHVFGTLWGSPTTFTLVFLILAYRRPYRRPIFTLYFIGFFFLDQAPGKINFPKAVTWVRIMEKLDIFYIENVKFHGESEKHMIRWVILGL